MSKFIIAAATAFTLAVPAFAADVPRQPYTPYAPAPLGGFNWAGAYFGVNVGYQFGSLSGSPLKPSGIAGGIQGGYNWQSGQLVLGVETDIQGSAANDTFAAYKFSNPWFGTLRGRAGIAMNNVLIYATAGLAYGGGRVDAFGLSELQNSFGWAAGGGIEVGLTQNWSAKAEYLYIDLNANNYVLTGTSNGIQSSMLRFGVNYRF